jgi:hypothetical protein
MARLYGFDRDTAMKLRKRAAKQSTGGTGGKATLLPKRKKSEEFLFRFELLGDFSSGSAPAIIKHMDGEELSPSEILLDPELVFDTLEEGDTGYCIRQLEKFYAIQAPCPTGGE